MVEENCGTRELVKVDGDATGLGSNVNTKCRSLCKLGPDVNTQ